MANNPEGKKLTQEQAQEALRLLRLFVNEYPDGDLLEVWAMASSFLDDADGVESHHEQERGFIIWAAHKFSIENQE